MVNWLFEALVFGAGIGCGILLAWLGVRLSPAKRRERDMTSARRRILTDLRESHDKEILREAFHATEALRAELFKSVHRLRASMSMALAPVQQPPDKPQEADSPPKAEPDKSPQA